MARFALKYFIFDDDRQSHSAHSSASAASYSANSLESKLIRCDYIRGGNGGKRNGRVRLYMEVIWLSVNWKCRRTKCSWQLKWSATYYFSPVFAASRFEFASIFSALNCVRQRHILILMNCYAQIVRFNYVYME